MLRGNGETRPYVALCVRGAGCLNGNGETRPYVALCIGAGGVDGGDEIRPLAVGPVGAGLAGRVGCVER